MQPRIDNALIAAARCYGTTIHAIQGGSRTRTASRARRVLWHVLIKECGFTLQQAADCAGIADHTSVIYALKQDVDPSDYAAIRRAALGEQTTIDDCREWLADWPRIRAALRWHAADDDAVQDALDGLSGLDELRRRLQ